MVTFFFLLSGFCIALGYGDKFETLQGKNYLQFVWKRIKKIYPLYAVTMLVVYVITISGAESTGVSVGEATKQLFLGLTMLQTLTVKNWGILNSAAWYMSCIFVLYAVTPLILKAFHKKKKHTLLVSVVVVFGLMCVVMMTGYQFFLADDWNLIQYVTPYCRVFIYIIGILSGKLFRLCSDKSRLQGSVAELTVLALCIGAYVWGMTKQALDPIVTILYVPVFCIFLFVLSKEKGILSKFLNGRLNVWLGGISMDIYLIHYVVAMYVQLPFAARLKPDAPYSVYVFMIGLFALTMVLAIISNKLTGWLLITKEKR